jgi:hypothetical protein
MIFTNALCKWEAIDSWNVLGFSSSINLKMPLPRPLSKQKLNRWYQPWKAKGTTLLFFHGAVMVLWDF